MFFVGSSFESPFGFLFDLVLRPFSNNISTKMATEGPKRGSKGAWRGGSYFEEPPRELQERGGGTPVGAVSGARRLLPEGSDHYIIIFWAASGGKPKECHFC